MFSQRSRRAPCPGIGAIAFLGAGFAFAAAAPPAAANTIVIYASPGGSGTACSISKPCSLTGAKAAAAKAVQHSSADVHVELAGGTYQLAAPLNFGPQDSGSTGHRVVWEPAGSGQPLLSGGVAVTGWQQTSSDSNVWAAHVPASLRTRQLYADGNRIPRTSGQSPVELTQTSDGFLAADDTLASWRNPSNIEFVFDGGHGPWTQSRCDVAGIEGRVITMRQPCWSNMKLPNTPTAPDGDNPSGGFPSLDSSATPSRIENAYELL